MNTHTQKKKKGTNHDNYTCLVADYLKMAFKKSCRECGREYTDPSNFRRHIRSCGKRQQDRGHYQCPYCRSTWARRDDVLAKHVLYKHTEKVSEVMKNKELIKYISPRDSAMTDDEARDIAFLETLDRETRPYLGGSAEERDELQAQLEKRVINKEITIDERRVVSATNSPRRDDAHEEQSSDEEEPRKKKPRKEEQSVKISSSNTLTSITKGPENNTWQTKQDGPDFNADATEPGSPTPGNLPVDMMNSPYVPNCQSKDAQTDGFSKEELLQSCPHGAKLPVHEHRHKMKIYPDGTKEIQSETLVNCAECPRPSIKYDFTGF